MPFPEVAYLFSRRVEDNYEIYAIDASLQHEIRLTRQAARDVYPSLSPDRHRQ
ncbi:TolB-like translocation protein [Catalinimonas niigatensis]|uniref:hypothetical protein n=1 Tax=Catalinimonas niigatensis TaxID=1397264 RepID=UPI0026660C7B|nr:hypothetical protein [Catalinimonas niigatensis]WPP49758.1 hypothetical protein PZB72_24095 [Catalinimonas niigatensis]